MGYIYKITNIKNGKVYIGKTEQTIEQRYRQHIKNAKNKVNRYLYDAMNCYGFDNFTLEEVEECDNADLNDREIFWIKEYSSNDFNYGYNMTTGGDGGNVWRNNPHKEETIRKIKETKIKNGTWGIGFPKGKTHPSKGKHFNKADEDEIFSEIKKGISIKEIEQNFGISRRTIYSWCINKYGCSYGRLREAPIQREKGNGVYSEEKRQASSERWKGEKNPNYKDVPEDKLLELLKTDKTIQEIAEYFRVSKQTIIAKSKKYWNKTPKEKRKEL